MRLSRSFPFLLCAAAFAQQAAAPPPTAEVQSDNRVLFRIKAPDAKEVFVNREGAKRAEMTKGDDGVWSLTTEALEPDYYGYSFQIDGTAVMDPRNPLIKPNLLGMQNMVHVPAPPSTPWEMSEIPHGQVQHHFYHSGVVGDNRDFFVYTPPGYDATAKRTYPVLYLLHGFSDDASAWTAVGKANLILDHMIAEGKAKPMLVVMPLGYGAPEILTRNGLRSPDLRTRNYDNFRKALTTEVIPQVEKQYRVNRDRNSRAIAGLSMGGAESLLTGLNDLDQFAWIGSFSAGGAGNDYDSAFPAMNGKANQRIRLLWIACGTEDGLIASNRKFKDWLTSKGVKFTSVETPGMHTWMVWRRNLAAFTPLLFQ